MPGSEDPAPRESASGPTHRWVSPLPYLAFTPRSATTGTVLGRGAADKDPTLRSSPAAQRDHKLCGHVTPGASSPHCEAGWVLEGGVQMAQRRARRSQDRFHQGATTGGGNNR